MAFLEVNNVRIVGMSAGVPKRVMMRQRLWSRRACWSAGWTISRRPTSVFQQLSS